MHECLQYLPLSVSNEGPNPILGSEDCLHLNVYSPNLNDVVVVTINYRLGLLGFLSTEDDVVPGNNGLKDQILALRWIKENIQYFGGNSSSITITGASAGAASVHFHTLSSKSKGLFHKAISSSGSMLNHWALMENSLSKTKQLANLVGCTTENVEEMVDCLRERPGQQIVAQYPKFNVWHSTPFCTFAPVLDSWSADPVFPQHPYQLLKEKKVNDVPWMLGEMAVEGHINGFEYYSEETLKYLDEHWNELMPYILGYNSTAKSSDSQIIGEKIRQEYLGVEVPTIGNLKKLLKIFSDRLFSADFDKSLRMHSTAIKSPVYYYLFNYRGTHSFTELTTKTNEDLGATHGDDLMYLTSSLLDSQSTEQDRSMTKLMVDIYLSFARNGKPETNQVHWEPVSKIEMDPIKYLNINSPSSLVSGESTQLGNRKFWDSLPFQENENFKEDGN
ncbi:hypothetical protein WA026_005163 [Henosepilachna vigintioctopunctata]|uniref:Carboxylic ester hydrolase n=1 Tax=Henosepilachna vigintioctopunctata TaxID=420089 RepID=A0AAW1UN70_9CUCU